ncbi:MAG: DUF2975 domain-containing protein [Psychrobium sp.]
MVISHILLLGWGAVVDGRYVLSQEFGVLSVLVNYSVTGSWQSIALDLQEEQFNVLMILGTAQLLPSVLIYLFVFKLFSLFERGKVFSVAHARYLKYIGTTLFFWIALNIVYPIVVTLSIRLFGLSESLPLHINVSSTEFSYLLYGLIIYAMAAVIGKAITMKEEQELVI